MSRLMQFRNICSAIPCIPCNGSKVFAKNVSSSACLTQVPNLPTIERICLLRSRRLEIQGPVKSMFNQFCIANQRRVYSRHATTTGLDANLNPSEAAKRKAKGKTAEPEKILLISETQNIAITTLADAEKMARKKGFQLVEVVDQEKKLHSDKKVYKFESLAQHFGEDWKKRLHQDDTSNDSDKEEDKKERRKKEDKTILLTSKISKHDLEAKVKQLNRLAEKGHPIRVFISGGGDPEFVFQEIQKLLTPAAKIHQKKASGTEIRLHILPHTPSAEESNDTNDGASRQSDLKNKNKATATSVEPEPESNKDS